MTDRTLRTALADHATPLSSADPSAEFEDTTDLGEWFPTAEVVGLGEATHGTREFFAVRHRLTRHLVEECGFRTVAVEDEPGSVTAASEYVAGADRDPRAVVRDLRPWWHTEGTVALLRWLRTFNDGRRAEERVRLRGVDVGDPAGAATTVRSTLRTCDPDYYRSIRAVLDPLASGDVREYGVERADWFERAAGVTREAADRIRRASTERDADHLAFLARAVAGTCEWYRDGGAAEGLSAEGYEARDRTMARNTARLARRRDGGVVFWGHNGHVMRGTFDDGRPWSDRETAGQSLHREFGDGYRPVGTDFAQGRFRAIDVSTDEGEYDTFAAGDPPATAPSAHLAELDPTPLFLDLVTAADDPRLAAFFGDPRRVRNVEATYGPGDDHRHYAETDVPASFDALVHFDRTRPARPVGTTPG